MSTNNVTTHFAPPASAFKRIAGQREVSLGAVALVLVVLFSVLSSRFATLPTLGQIVADLSIVLIVGIGEAIVIFTKNIDVSVGSMVGLTAFFAADFGSKHQTVPLIFVILLSCFLGLVLGSINGLLVSTLKVPAIMVTLGTLYIYRGMDAALAGSGQVTVQALPPGYNDIAGWTFFGFPGIFLYAAVIAAITAVFMRFTFFGRSLLALGSNPLAAEKQGVRSKRGIFFAFALSGLLCGFAGVLWGARYGTIDSSSASGFELVILAAVVVGGVSVNGGSGTIIGVALGALILQIISIGLGLLNVSQFWLQAIEGAVIILAIVFDLIVRRRTESKGQRA